MSVVLGTRHWGGLGLALLMQRQGSEVTCAVDFGGLDGKELKATEQIGEGLVERIALEQAVRKMTDPETLWVFDANDLAPQSEKLREQGRLVLGTSALAKKLEDDRDYAAEVAQSVGLSLPETEEFTDYGKALQFLKQNADTSYVYKPDKQDPTATYVPLHPDEPDQANAEVQRYLQTLEAGGSPKFILQEQVQGIEANFELWLSHGQPLIAFCDLESKRRLTGDLGDLCGCAGGYNFTVPIEHPLIQQTVGRYLQWPELKDYTGSVDANVILKDGEALFLENCFRFGYNAYPALMQSLALAPVESLFRAWVNGDSVTESFDSGIAGSLTVMVDHPRLGSPLIIPSDLEADTYLYRAYAEKDGIRMVDQWSEVCCVTSLGSSIEEVGTLNLHKAERIGAPNAGYRTDLADDTSEHLPAARFAALADLGLQVEAQPV